MTGELHFDDARSVADFKLFLERALTATDGVVRVTVGDGTLRATVCTFSPFGLLDTAATVLGMRVFAETSGAAHDLVLSGRALLDRIAHLADGDAHISIPPTRETATWVGIEPPRDGWQHIADVPAALFGEVAQKGFATVAEALPADAGEPVVREIRNSVWSQPLSGAEFLPSSVAFTAHLLGFLTSAEAVRVYESGRWMRASTPHGHVLVYRR